MKYPFYIAILAFSTSCLSPSDKQHTCRCDYDDNTEQVIMGVSNFIDLDLGKKCDQECGFRRLLILFYDDSDSSKKTIEMIESSQTIVNSINGNFSFVCLSTESQDVNVKFQQMRFGTTQQPFFAVLTSHNDSLITSFGYLDEAGKIRSRLSKCLY